MTAPAASRAATGTVSTPPVPQPVAVYAVVVADYGARTLYVRLPDDGAAGYLRGLWADAWIALRAAEERGWAPTRNGPPDVRASIPGNSATTPGRAADGGGLIFAFPADAPSSAGYGQLIATPRLTALVALDRSRRCFLSVRFLHRPG